jgi:hypothetical protein
MTRYLFRTARTNVVACVCLFFRGSIQMGYLKEGSPGGFGNWGRVAL